MADVYSQAFTRNLVKFKARSFRWYIAVILERKDGKLDGRFISGKIAFQISTREHLISREVVRKENALSSCEAWPAEVSLQQCKLTEDAERTVDRSVPFGSRPLPPDWSKTRTFTIILVVNLQRQSLLPTLCLTMYRH